MPRVDLSPKKSMRAFYPVVQLNSHCNLSQAKKFYESALRLEPGYLGAALALAELHVIEGRNGDAVSLLERYLNDWADDSLNVKLAQVFAATNMLQEALSHYHAALRLKPYFGCFLICSLLGKLRGRLFTECLTRFLQPS